MKARLTTAIITLGLLAGCKSATTYRRPAVAAPPAFRGAPNTTPDNPASLADLKWFEVFKDERLQELIRTARTNNYDLRDAVARVATASANLGLREADRLPGVSAAAD